MKRWSWIVLGSVAVGGLVWGISTSIAQFPDRDGRGQPGPRRDGPDDRRYDRRGPGPEDRPPNGPFGGPQHGFPGGPPPGGHMGGPPPIPPTRFLRVLDLNKDYEISSDEIAKASDSLRRLDIDQDGLISEEEYTMPPPPPPRSGPHGNPHGGPPQSGPGEPRHDRRPPHQDFDGVDPSRRPPPSNEPDPVTSEAEPTE